MKFHEISPRDPGSRPHVDSTDRTDRRGGVLGPVPAGGGERARSDGSDLSG